MLEYELYKLGRRSIFTRRQWLGEFLGYREHASVAEGGDGFEHCQKADGWTQTGQKHLNHGVDDTKAQRPSLPPSLHFRESHKKASVISVTESDNERRGVRGRGPSRVRPTAKSLILF